jgi:3-oxoacyl-(acyl-carrier-protein) synthase
MGKIFVTGMGVISAIGDNLSANHAALKAGTGGIRNLELLSSHFAGRLPCGEIKISTEALKERLKAGEKGVTRTSLLALHAFTEAIASGDLSPEQVQAEDTALVGASTVGGMCLTDDMYRDANQSSGGSEYLSSYDFASVDLYLQRRFRLQGIVNTINTACSSSANAIMYGARLLKHGLARRAIVGGADSLAKFTINGFNALQILSPEACRPFDAGRKGLNLGEGAAFLVLEKEEDCRHKTVYAELSGYGNANDAFHPSSLSNEGHGPYLAMTEALRTAGLQPGDISFVNAHGTGTENNDLVESSAMLRVFGKDVPGFTSTKPNTGHTLGAAAAIEAAYSILSLRHQETYAGLNFSAPIPETGLRPVTTYLQKEIRHVLSNSFGFGGNCSTLAFSRI